MKTLILLILFAQFTDRAEILKRISNKEANIFFNSVWDSSELISNEYGVPVCISLAVSYLETKAGKSENCRINNNFFNLSICGKNTQFSCKEESFVFFAMELEKCKDDKTKNNVFEYLKILKRCKGENYSKKIESIIKKFGLYLA